MFSFASAVVSKPSFYFLFIFAAAPQSGKRIIVPEPWPGKAGRRPCRRHFRRRTESKGPINISLTRLGEITTLGLFLATFYLFSIHLNKQFQRVVCIFKVSRVLWLRYFRFSSLALIWAFLTTFYKYWAKILLIFLVTLDRFEVWPWTNLI